jgi:RES domain-containing protein
MSIAVECERFTLAAQRMSKRIPTGIAVSGKLCLPSGDKLCGGRWNSPGVSMVYTSESLALAALEILAHLGQSSTLASYSRCAVHFDEAVITSLDRSLLPANWRVYPAPSELQLIGNRWVAGCVARIILRRESP